MVTRLESQAEKEKAAYEKALAKYTPSAEYQAAIDHLAKAKAYLAYAPKLKAVCQGTILLCLAPA